jgi:hypothetical protein
MKVLALEKHQKIEIPRATKVCYDDGVYRHGGEERVPRSVS